MRFLLRWIARLSAAASAFLIGAFFFGDGPPAPETVTDALLTGCLLTLWIGLIVGWLDEVRGGAMTLGGLILFYLVQRASAGTWPGGPWFGLVASPGVLYLFSAALRRERDAPPAP